MFSGSSNSFDLPRTRLSEYFPFLCDKDGGKIPKGDLLLMQRELDKHTEKIKRTFAVLVLDLQNNIEDKGKTRDLITFLKNFDRKKFHEISRSSIVDEVFNDVSPHFSFFDFGIIKHLTSKFGSDYNKQRLKKYKRMFKKYCEQRVCECPSDAFGDIKESEKVFIIKVDKNIQNLTLEEVNSLKLEIKAALFRNDKDLRLLKIEEGCVKLSFRALNIDEVALTEEQEQLCETVVVNDCV